MENTSQLETAFPKTKTAMAALESYACAMVTRKMLDPHPPKAKSNAKSSDDPVCHNHHILPKALFPQFAKKKWNIVRLTLPEHFNAHVLLAKVMNEQIAVHRALYVMTKRYPVEDSDFDWKQAGESEKQTNAAASILQSRRRTEDWKSPAYRKKISAAITRRNIQDWQDADVRRERTAAITKGRQEKFFANPDAVARATAAQSQKTSAEKHWRFQPVNIYRHTDGALVAEHVCLTDYCKRHKLNQPHMQTSLSADRTRPSGRGNRAHSKGYFARALDENGAVIGEVCPAVPPKDHHHAKRANIYRASDDVCVARNVIIRQFCQNNDLGPKLSQGALSRTAYSDRSKPSTRENPTHHKGYYAVYKTVGEKE